MRAVFIYLPWTALRCRDLFGQYMETMGSRGLWEDTFALIPQHRVDPAAEDVPPLGSPLVRLHHELQLLRWETLCAVPPDFPNDVQAFRESLRSWGEVYHLTQPWCLDWVLSRLHEWGVHTLDTYVGSLGPNHQGRHLSSGLHRERERALSEEDARVLASRTFRRPGSVWEPHRESKSEARERAIAAFAATLDQDLVDIEETFALRGWQPVPRLRYAPHFEWLVRYQCNEENVTTIAKDTYRTRQAVSEPIHALADLIGLPLRRPNKGGRKPGARDVTPRHRAR